MQFPKTLQEKKNFINGFRALQENKAKQSRKTNRDGMACVINEFYGIS